MKKANCILCDHDAKRGVYSGSKEPTKDAGGFKYKCPECGLYALDGFAYNWIEMFASSQQKKTLSRHIKENPAAEGYFKVLRWTEIQRILGLHSKRRG